MKRIAINILKTVFYRCYFLYASIYIRALYSKQHKSGNLSYLSDEDYRIWLDAMLSLMKEHCFSNYGFGTRLVYETFAKANIENVRVREYSDTENPIIVLCVKNDKKRLSMLVEHYRSLGVERFAFLDNGSTDGTLEWMLEQDDIDVFTTDDMYNCLVKEGWINRIVSHYGFDRWYILTDSDELSTYVGMESHSLRDVTAYGRKNGIKRFKGINLDMYADAPLFSIASENIDIKDTYCWMDSDSYIELPRKVAKTTITAVNGGPRYRVMNVPCSVMKYPLVYFEKGTVSANAHFQYPYSIIEESPCCIGILHYKFLDSDKKEFGRRANFGTGLSSGFAKTGVYYQQYLKASEGSQTFMYDGSVRFDSSEALKKIPLFEVIGF